MYSCINRHATEEVTLIVSGVTSWTRQTATLIQYEKGFRRRGPLGVHYLIMFYSEISAFLSKCLLCIAFSLVAISEVHFKLAVKRKWRLSTS